MHTGQARMIVKEWIHDYGKKNQTYIGAYYSGSTLHLSDEDPLPPHSDMDVMLVIDDSEPREKLGKFRYKDLLMEVTILTWPELESVEGVLASYHLASSLRVNTIIDDPSGRLVRLQDQVEKLFPKREWVELRCHKVRDRIEAGLQHIDPERPLHEQVTAWVFPTGIMCHLILVANKQNPTVRKRYLAAREVLSAHGLQDFYPKLLALLGCTHLSPSQIERYVDRLEQLFDAAANASVTPFLFRSDITPEARVIAIEGSRSMIHQGNHHEAMFWIIATYARCHTILAADAPDIHQRLFSDFEEMLRHLGVSSHEALKKRADEGLQLLPELWAVTEKIIQANECQMS
ncbi:hypothetical protein [Paenibacillus sp. 1001270B_150601_E10]|uniref:hypothetical protein n=1 Tax=Paenibacillus sp. 1001270B_150601_E10 TaxID=2787079 RepID=UPI00189D19A0|nr:hypothetical protein [Paenibacillus sp. 1001270B_150601_E10]